MKSNKSDAIFPIAVASKLVGLTPKMLRIYEKEGLFRPQRTPDTKKMRGRRLYSQNDVEYLSILRELISSGYNIKQLNSFYEFINSNVKNKHFKSKEEMLTNFYEFLTPKTKWI